MYIHVCIQLLCLTQAKEAKLLLLRLIIILPYRLCTIRERAGLNNISFWTDDYGRNYKRVGVESREMLQSNNKMGYKIIATVLYKQNHTVAVVVCVSRSNDILLLYFPGRQTGRELNDKGESSSTKPTAVEATPKPDQQMQEFLLLSLVQMWPFEQVLLRSCTAQ